MIDDDNKTLWCGNLAEQVTEEILYELFLQAGPLEKVKIVRDRDGRQRNFAFITFCHEVSVPYALNLFRGSALFNKTLSLQCRGRVALLPPPIRCYGPEPMIEFHGQNTVAQQFVSMTEKLSDDMLSLQNIRQVQDNPDNLVLASLQGNWSHRHHPYRPKDNKNTRQDYRSRDNGSDNYHSSSSRNKPNNWRDRRNYKKGNNYHRRD